MKFCHLKKRVFLLKFNKSSSPRWVMYKNIFVLLFGIKKTTFAKKFKYKNNMEKRKTSKHKTSNLFNRYVWLVDTIYRRGKITYEEISDLWSRSTLNEDGEELPLRTFHNHRQAIEEMFDINIECDKRNNFTYYIENSEDMKRGGVRSWLLNTFTINRLINESHKMKHRILFEQIPSGQRFLTPIIEAMRDDLIIKITYQSFWNDSPRIYEIEPYCVKVFRQRWYVVAKSQFHNSVRTFSLDRIQNLQTTEKKFKLPKKFCPETFFKDAFGIIVDRDVETCEVQIKAFGNKRKYFQTLPLHHSQEELVISENESIFSYYLSPTFDFRQELLSHGDEITVLSPQWLREEIREIARKVVIDSEE